MLLGAKTAACSPSFLPTCTFLGFHSEVLGLVADSVRNILRTLSATKPRSSDWKPIHSTAGFVVRQRRGMDGWIAKTEGSFLHSFLPVSICESPPSSPCFHDISFPDEIHQCFRCTKLWRQRRRWEKCITVVGTHSERGSTKECRPRLHHRTFLGFKV